MKKQKWFTVIVITFLAIVLGACGADKETKDKLAEIEQEITEGLDEEMTLDILANDKVESGYVQDIDGTAKAVLVFKEDTTDEDKATLTNQYNEELMEKYPDKNINVIVNEIE